SPTFCATPKTRKNCDEEVAASQARVCRDSAAQLGLAVERVLPLSARQGLLARVRGDDRLLAHSRFGELEALLGERLVADRGRLIAEQVVTPLHEMLRASRTLFEQRIAQVAEQQRAFAAEETDQETLLAELEERVRDEHGEYHKRLLALRGQQALLRRQAELLRERVAPERLE